MHVVNKEREARTTAVRKAQEKGEEALSTERQRCEKLRLQAEAADERERRAHADGAALAASLRQEHHAASERHSEAEEQCKRRLEQAERSHAEALTACKRRLEQTERSHAEALTALEGRLGRARGQAREAESKLVEQQQASRVQQQQQQQQQLALEARVRKADEAARAADERRLEAERRFEQLLAESERRRTELEAERRVEQQLDAEARRRAEDEAVSVQQDLRAARQETAAALELNTTLRLELAQAAAVTSAAAAAAAAASAAAASASAAAPPPPAPGPVVLAYERLAEATDGFADANVVGSGGFGVVYRASTLPLALASSSSSASAAAAAASAPASASVAPPHGACAVKLLSSGAISLDIH